MSLSRFRQYMMSLKVSLHLYIILLVWPKQRFVIERFLSAKKSKSGSGSRSEELRIRDTVLGGNVPAVFLQDRTRG